MIPFPLPKDPQDQLKEQEDFLDVENEECFSVRFNQYNTHVACGYSTGRLGIFSLDAPNEKKKIVIPQISEFPITCLRWKPQNRTTLLAVTADGMIQQIHSTSGKLLNKLEEKGNPLMCVDYSCDGFLFATGGNDKKVRLYDDNTKTLISKLEAKKFSLPEHSNRIFSVKFHPLDPNVLVSGGWDNNLLIYDTRAREVQGALYGPHICGDGIDIKGSTMLTVSWEKVDQVQFWDLKMMKNISTIQCYTTKDANINKNSTYLYSGRFHPRYNLFGVTGSNKNMMRIYSSEGENLVKDYPLEFENIKIECPCYSIDFSSDGEKAAVGTADSAVRLINIRKRK